jgi:hypothetical protein
LTAKVKTDEVCKAILQFHPIIALSTGRGCQCHKALTGVVNPTKSKVTTHALSVGEGVAERRRVWLKFGFQNFSGRTPTILNFHLTIAFPVGEGVRTVKVLTDKFTKQFYKSQPQYSPLHWERVSMPQRIDGCG